MGSNILVVDDEKSVCEYVEAVLSDLSNEITFLTKPNLLWKRLETTPVDLILMDLIMPEMDGLTLLKQLKTHPEYSKIPVIMLTGATDDQTFTECFEQGAFDYIYKPINDTILTARVRSALEINTTLQRREKNAREFIDALNASMEKKIEELSNQFISLARTHTEELTDREVEQIQILKRVSLFEDMNPFDLRLIVQDLTLQTIEVGQELLTQGQAVSTIYFIKEGIVEILVEGDRVAQRGPGDSIGEMSCLSDDPVASATVQTVTRCQA